MWFSQCAASLSTLLRMRFSQCAASPSWGLANVQWAPYPSLGLKDEVHPVCGEPVILPGWSVHSVQWSPDLWHCLRDEVYPLCSGRIIPCRRWGLPSVQWPLIPDWACMMKCIQCATSPSSPWDEVYQCATSASYLPRMRFTYCAVGPSSLLRDKVYLVWCRPLISLERWGLSIVRWAPHSWLCLIDEVYPMYNGTPNLHSASDYELYPLCSGP